MAEGSSLLAVLSWAFFVALAVAANGRRSSALVKAPCRRKLTVSMSSSLNPFRVSIIVARGSPSEVPPIVPVSVTSGQGSAAPSSHTGAISLSSDAGLACWLTNDTQRETGVGWNSSPGSKLMTLRCYLKRLFPVLLRRGGR